jgi:hypothetical protein
MSRRREPTVRRLARDARGAGLGEYIVVVGVIALLAILGYRAFGRGALNSVQHEGQLVASLEGTAGSANAGAPPAGGPAGSSQPGATGAAPAPAPGSAPPSYQAPRCNGSTCSDGMNCFVAGTLVATPDGARPIEAIHAGDAVLSALEGSGETVVERVAATFVTPDAALVDVRLSDGEDVHATPGHRFWTYDRGWVEAERLVRGEHLGSAALGDLWVEAVEPLPARATVYNFEVERSHTYFVGAGQAWVHNPITCKSGGDQINWYPQPQDVSQALDQYGSHHNGKPDPNSARIQPPMSPSAFFKGNPDQNVTQSANAANINIELLQSGGGPIPFFSFNFGGNDLKWDDRYSDQALYNLFESPNIGIHGVLPPARYYPDLGGKGKPPGRTLALAWPMFTPFGEQDGAKLTAITGSFSPQQLRQEIANAAVVSYLSGNWDGPEANPNNAGFARNPDGTWHAVLIDLGAAYNQDVQHAGKWPTLDNPIKAIDHRPWNANVLGNQGVKKDDLSPALQQGLQNISAASTAQLAQYSGFPPMSGGGYHGDVIGKMQGVQWRAHETLDHYGIDHTFDGRPFRYSP